MKLWGFFTALQHQPRQHSHYCRLMRLVSTSSIPNASSAAASAASATSSAPPRLFDMSVKRLHRQRQPLASETAISHWAYLRDEVGERVVDRLLDISRKRWSKVLDYGCGAGGQHLMKWMDVSGEIGEESSSSSSSDILVDNMVIMDISGLKKTFNHG